MSTMTRIPNPYAGIPGTQHSKNVGDGVLLTAVKMVGGGFKVMLPGRESELFYPEDDTTREGLLQSRDVVNKIKLFFDGRDYVNPGRHSQQFIDECKQHFLTLQNN